MNSSMFVKRTQTMNQDTDNSQTEGDNDTKYQSLGGGRHTLYGGSLGSISEEDAGGDSSFILAGQEKQQKKKPKYDCINQAYHLGIIRTLDGIINKLLAFIG